MVGCQIISSEKRSDWLGKLLCTSFFVSCDNHKSARKKEKNIFCIDCEIGICKHCVNSEAHNVHKYLQICKYVYQDVVRFQDIQKYLDCSSIQTYKINGEKAVHLNARPQCKDSKPSTKAKYASACEVCGRYIQDIPNRFCSIRCKVSIECMEHKDPKHKMLFSIPDFPQIKLKEINHKKGSEYEEEEEIRKYPMIYHQISSSYECRGCWMISSLKGKRHMCKRKGVPQRAPFF